MNQNDKFHQDAQYASHEISDDALNSVAGGIVNGSLFPELKCPYCGQSGKWGYYGGTLRCMACMKYYPEGSHAGGNKL